MKKVYTPSDLVELTVLKGILDGEGIRYSVRNENMGSLFEGVQVSLFNARDILVADEDVERAVEVINDYLAQAKSEPTTLGPGARKKSRRLRLVSILLFAWAVIFLFLLLKGI